MIHSFVCLGTKQTTNKPQTNHKPSTKATELSSKRFAAPLWKISRSLNRLNIGLRHVYEGVANEAELNDSIHVMREFSKAVIEERRKLSQQELDERTDLLSRFMVLKDKNGSVYSDDFLQ